MPKRAAPALAGIATVLTLVPVLAGVATFHVPHPAPAEIAPRTERVIVVVVRDLTVEQLADMPAVRALRGRAAFGLLSSAGRGVAAATAGTLSISAGTRAVAPDPGELPLALPPELFRRAEPGPGAEAYRARTGNAPPLEAGPFGPRTSEWLYPDIALVRRLNRRLEVRAEPGLLGDALQEARIARAAIALAEPEAVRLAPLLAMDSAGVVPDGGIASVPEITAAIESRAGVRFLAVDGGGPATASAVLDAVVPVLGEHDALVVLSPDPPPEVARERTWLSPILTVAPALRPGILVSDSTRRAGVVSNVDVLPTVLAWLAVDRPPPTIGTILSSTPESRPLERVTGDFAVYARVARQRGPVFVAVTALGVAAIAAGLAAGLRRGRSRPAPDPLSRSATVLLLAAAAVPLVLLAEPLLASESLAVTIVFVLGLAVLAGAVLERAVPDRRVAFAALAGGAVAVLSVDVLVGSPLGARSLLGFTVAGGTRFFGLGSEEMGVVLAGVFVTGALVTDRGGRRARTAAVIVAVALVVVFAAPPFGAKFGMALTAVPALAIAAVAWTGTRLTARAAAAAVVLTVAAAVLLVDVAILLGRAGGHVGAEARVVGEEGAGAVASVLVRRARVALDLSTGLWAWLVAAGVATWLVLAVPARSRWMRARTRGLRGAAWGLGAAALAGLAFNDAGPVVVATMVLVAAPAMISAVLLEPPS